MRRLEIENKNKTDKEQAKIENHKQIIDSIAIDVDYDGDLFNAEIIDTPSKKEDEAKVFRHLQDTIHNWLVTRSTNELTKDEIDAWVRHKDYWMNGKDVIELGFADGVPQ